MKLFRGLVFGLVLVYASIANAADTKIVVTIYTASFSHVPISARFVESVRIRYEYPNGNRTEWMLLESWMMDHKVQSRQYTEDLSFGSATKYQLKVSGYGTKYFYDGASPAQNWKCGMSTSCASWRNIGEMTWLDLSGYYNVVPSGQN